MRIMLTGGAGFIGSHLVHRLSAVPDVQLVIYDDLSRFPAKVIECTSGAGHTVIRGALSHGRRLARALRGCDIVYHLAAESRVRSAEARPDICFQSNVAGTLELLQRSEEAGVKRVVFTSSREVYGEPDQLPVSETDRLNPKNVYGKSKLAAEQHCFEYASRGLEVAVLRLANVYGPGDVDRVIPKFADLAHSGRPLILRGGSQIIDFVWIDHVVDALARAGLGPYVAGPVNIGSGKGVTIQELAERVIALTRSRSRLKIVPQDQQEVTRFIADVSKAKAAFELPAIDDSLALLGSMLFTPPESTRRQPFSEACMANASLF
jgi:UDP-glucose 4-epimerase